MAFDFEESFILAIPDVREQLTRFEEGAYQESHGLIIEVAAIHEGVTGNYTYYAAEQLEAALDTWLTPYAKPVLRNHDLTGEPIGRVLGAKMDKEADGTPYVRLQLAITDPSAIEKIRSKRYLTGSIGGTAERAICSISGEDISESMPKYKRGKHYKGKLAYLKLEGLSFKEYSFVNAPSDSRSMIVNIEEAVENGSEWVNSARFFSLDLNDEAIVEFGESEDVELLDNMKKKDAASLYRNMKGAFIEANILNKSEEDVVKGNKNHTTENSDSISDSEEHDMADESVVDNDDILEVVEAMAEEQAEAAPAAEEPEEEVIEEGKKAEGQEKEKTSQINAETSEGAPKNRESEEEAPTEEEAAVEVPEEEEAQEEDTETPEVTAEETPADEPEEEPSSDEPEAEAAAEEAPAEEEEPSEEEEVTASAEADESELSVTEDEEPESPESELQARVEALEEENKRLRTMLKRQLAEKLVDRKISLGMIESATRKEAIDSHVERTAASLRDALSDLEAVKEKLVTTPADLSDLMETESVAVQSKQPADLEADDSSEQVTEEESEEEQFVVALSDRLLGRSHW